MSIFLNNVLDTEQKHHTFSLYTSNSQFANDIKSIINKSDPNKAHGHDMISICITKLFGDSVYEPFEIIFKPCLKQAIFPEECKKANVVSVLKNCDHQCVKTTYRFLFFQFLINYLKD